MLNNFYPKILIFIFFIFNFSFANIMNGIGMEMQNNGTIISYMPNYNFNKNLSLISDIGYYYSSSQNNSLLLMLGSSYMLKENYLGIFNTRISFQMGSSIDLIQPIKFKNEKFLYNFALAYNFTNIDFLNDFMIRFNNFFELDKNISIKLSIFWI